MIEVKVVEYLMGKTSAGNDVYAQRPESPQKKYIVIEKTGSEINNMIKSSTIAVQSIVDSKGGSLLDAISLNDEVIQAMLNIITDDDIVKCDLNSDYNWTDSSTKEYRYQAVFEIIHY